MGRSKRKKPSVELDPVDKLGLKALFDKDLLDALDNEAKSRGFFSWFSFAEDYKETQKSLRKWRRIVGVLVLLFFGYVFYWLYMDMLEGGGMSPAEYQKAFPVKTR